MSKALSKQEIADMILNLFVHNDAALIVSLPAFKQLLDQWKESNE